MSSAKPEEQKLPWALIGAGPMGPSMAKKSSEQGIEFEGFEAHSDVGGLRDISSHRSTKYKSAHIVSSKTTTQFNDFPMSEQTANYPRHDVLLQVFHDFSTHFQLRQYNHFDCTVEHTPPLDSGWQVQWTDNTGKSHSKHLAGLVIANGTLTTANKPKFKGQFSGELFHSANDKDGSQQAYDMIVTATGYFLDYSFLDKSEPNWQGDAAHLYLNCFHSGRDDLSPRLYEHMMQRSMKLTKTKDSERSLAR